MTKCYLFWFYIINKFDLVSNCVLWFSEESNLGRCLASWYNTDPISDLIVHIGRLSVVSVGASLCFWAVS